ncbi:hypothetical protein GCM10027429_31060 [Marivirga atlantica]|jgi:hypothetical protein
MPMIVMRANKIISDLRTLGYNFLISMSDPFLILFKNNYLAKDKLNSVLKTRHIFTLHRKK